MKITVQSWGSGFDRLADQIRDMFQEMKGRNYFRSHAPLAWTPRVNLYETPEQYILCAELAGVCHSEVDVRVEAGTLRIEGVRSKPDLPDECSVQRHPHDMSVHLMEIDSGRFFRRFPLACDVATDRITARYRRGYLWVYLPRKEPTGQAE